MIALSPSKKSMKAELAPTDRWNTKAIGDRWTLTKAIWHREMIRLARQRHPAWRRVIDAGCGWTGMLERIWEQDWPIEQQPILGVGFDTSEESVAKCRNRVAETHRPILYLVAGFDDLMPFEGIEFDVIFCWEVMYLLDDAQLDRAIGAMRTLLSEDGIFVCGTLCHRSVPDEVMDSFYPNIAKNIAPNKPHWRLESDYVNMLRKHGLGVEVERIRVSQEEYAAKVEPLPPEKFWFESDAHRRTFYCDYGKSVWLCTPVGGAGLVGCTPEEPKRASKPEFDR